MKQLDLAIIIPTLNEEHYIAKLLTSLVNQTVGAKEIVVVDAKSKDKTAEIVKGFKKQLPQLQIFQIPKYTISRQRNLGVTKTNSSQLLFLDADMWLKDQDTLENYLGEVKKTNPDVAAADNLPTTNKLEHKLYFWLTNQTFRLARPIWPMATTQNMYMKRSWFEKVNGFDDAIRIGEDYDIVQRISRHGGKLKFLNNVKMYTSARRQEREGVTKFITKMIVSFFQIRLFGYHKNKTDYEFGKFGQE